MAYTPTEWACGDIVTAEKLNAIERGISEVNSEYVPTEWQCGDVITAEAMNKIEQGIANAEGGGSSDFSTAEVVLITGSSDEYLVSIPTCGTDPDYCAAIARFGGQNEFELIVPLYKGKAFASIGGPYTVSVTGDADYDDEEGIVTITGNCTVSVS